MTLPLELGGIQDSYVRRAFENIAQLFPLGIANVATTTSATLLGSYGTIHDVSTWVGAGTVVGTYYDTKAGLVGVGTAIASAHRTIYLDPADFAVSPLTAKLRVRLQLLTNGTAPTSTFSAALFPITATGGGAGLTQITTLGAAVGTTSTIVAPGINSGFEAHGSDISVPSAGHYLLGLIVATATTAANTGLNVVMTLQTRHV
jgi:hypothetical protein